MRWPKSRSARQLDAVSHGNILYNEQVSKLIRLGMPTAPCIHLMNAIARRRDVQLLMGSINLDSIFEWMMLH